MLAEEIFYRAGGLVRVNPILDEGLMLHAGAAKSTSLERLDHYSEVLADHYGLEGGSVMLIFSNSGRNAATIEMAHAAHERGLSVIAITNLMHSRSVESRHSSGKKLYEVANVVLDNYGCVGDAAIDVGTYRVGPTSTVVGAALLQALVCRIVELSLEDDRPIEVFAAVMLIVETTATLCIFKIPGKDSGFVVNRCLPKREGELLMQEQNFKSVVRTFETILEHDSITRGDIAEIIGCSVVTVCKAVELLLKNNLVTEEKEQFCGPGRKAKALRVCVHAHTILILDITKRCFQARLLYLDCKADQDTFEYEPQEEISFRGALHDFFEKCCQTFEQARPQNDSCIGIGVVVPGPYFEPEDRVVNKRFPELENLRLKKELEAIFGTRSIVIEEDVKLAGLYNIKRTYALHSRCAFYAYIDEGVGGSIIRNGEIELGAHAFAGDFGQMRDMDGVTVEEKICVPRFLSCFGQRRASFQTWETIRVQLERGGSEPCKIYDELVKTQ